MMKSFFFKSKSTYKNDELLFFFHGLSEPYPTDSLIKKMCIYYASTVQVYNKSSIMCW